VNGNDSRHPSPTARGQGRAADCGVRVHPIFLPWRVPAQIRVSLNMPPDAKPRSSKPFPCCAVQGRAVDKVVAQAAQPAVSRVANPRRCDQNEARTGLPAARRLAVGETADRLSALRTERGCAGVAQASCAPCHPLGAAAHGPTLSIALTGSSARQTFFLKSSTASAAFPHFHE